MESELPETETGRGQTEREGHAVDVAGTGVCQDAGEPCTITSSGVSCTFLTERGVVQKGEGEVSVDSSIGVRVCVCVV